MTYKETIDYLFAQVPMFQNLGAGAYKPGLETTLKLAEHWQNPHERLTTIHVGGTNGKGSTASTLSAILQAAGYKVGLYTSPHLVDFRERIRINGEPVPEQFVVRFVDEYISNNDLVNLHPTFFELTTIMAFAWFAEQKVDVAVIEVGLGGRLDCTNIITPILSIITNISLDHMALLGATEAKIAVEKAGIIKNGVPVIIGSAEGDVLKVFEDKAAETGSSLTLASADKVYQDAVVHKDSIEYKGTRWGDIRGELCGDCQRENAKTVLSALNHIVTRFPDIDASAVKQGFANVCKLTGLTGRWTELIAMILIVSGLIAGGLIPKLDYISSISRSFWSSIPFFIAFHINIFILITGYFGIKSVRHSVTKNLFLILSGLLIIFIFSLFDSSYNFDIKSLAFPLSNNPWWFMRIYIMLCLISPILNTVINSVNGREYLKIMILTMLIDVYFGYYQRMESVH